MAKSKPRCRAPKCAAPLEVHTGFRTPLQIASFCSPRYAPGYAPCERPLLPGPVYVTLGYGDEVRCRVGIIRAPLPVSLLALGVIGGLRLQHLFSFIAASQTLSFSATSLIRASATKSRTAAASFSSSEPSSRSVAQTSWAAPR